MPDPHFCCPSPLAVSPRSSDVPHRCTTGPCSPVIQKFLVFSPCLHSLHSIGVATRPDAPNYIDGQLRLSPQQQLCRKSAKLQSAAFSHCYCPRLATSLRGKGHLRHADMARSRSAVCAPPIQGHIEGQSSEGTRPELGRVR